MSENLDLVNNNMPLSERLAGFIRKIEDLGFDPHAIGDGTLDCHVLSQALSISPQIVLTYFELHIIDEEELEFLMSKELDMGIIRTLMLIEPQLRPIVYDKLDEYLKEARPIARIIKYLNSGEWRMTINYLWDVVDRKYWGAVSSYLKDIDFTDGTINKGIRSMLVQITRKATEKQLQWLERAIMHDFHNRFDIFTADTLEHRFPADVELVRKFVEDHERFESL